MTARPAVTALPRPAPRQVTVPSRPRAGSRLLRLGFGRMWQTVAETTGLGPVTINAFPAFGMPLNNGVALQVAELDEPWRKGSGLAFVPACSTA